MCLRETIFWASPHGTISLRSTSTQGAYLELILKHWKKYVFRVLSSVHYAFLNLILMSSSLWDVWVINIAPCISYYWREYPQLKISMPICLWIQNSNTDKKYIKIMYCLNVRAFWIDSTCTFELILYFKKIF